MYRTYTSSDVFSELSRLQRQFQRLSSPASSIRGFGQTDFPAINIGGTTESVEIHAFVWPPTRNCRVLAGMNVYFLLPPFSSAP